MAETVFDAKCPALCRLLAGSAFDADKGKAAAMQPDEFKAAFKREEFQLMPLFGKLCGLVIPEWREVGGDELERNLQRVVDTIGADKARSSFRDKLLVASENTLEDTLYEIAVTARACSVLDAGSVQIEKPILDPSKNPKHFKNSDVYGAFRGLPVRIEVTVLHDKPVGSVDLDLEELLKNANIGVGFRVEMRVFLQDQAAAESARGLLERLHAHHVASGGAEANIDGVSFAWKPPRYACIQGKSPFKTVQFFEAGDPRGDGATRDIRHPASVRRVTPAYVGEDFPNPEGVIEWGDLPGAADQVPVSKKIRDLLDGKLAQCEPGIINVVALGNPRQMNEAETRYALFGPPIGVVSYTKDEQGALQMGVGRLYRAPKAPFNPADQIEDPAVRAEFIEPFRKMSAVWHIRLGNHGRSEVFQNPNASSPIPEALAHLLAGGVTPDETRPQI